MYDCDAKLKRHLANLRRASKTYREKHKDDPAYISSRKTSNKKYYDMNKKAIQAKKKEKRVIAQQQEGKKFAKQYINFSYTRRKNKK